MSASTTAAAQGRSVPGPAKDPKVARALGNRRHLTNTLVKALCMAATVLGLALLGRSFSR